jgi:probable phosphoglycerate mutase
MCVSHQAVIMVFRYVVEELAESQLLEIDRSEQVANTSVTRYERREDGLWGLTAFNGVQHLESAERAPVTEENDVPSPA